MFTIQGEELQHIVVSMVKGARKARLGEKAVFIKAEGSYATFFFNGDDLQVERKVEVNITKEFDVATSMAELETKVGALPKDEKIMVELAGNTLLLKWGRSSKISCSTLPETSPLITIPDVIEQVKWNPGILHGLNNSMLCFCANSDSSEAKRMPVLMGVHLSKDVETDEVFARATNGYRAITHNSRGLEWFEGFDMTIPTGSIKSLADIMPGDAELSIGLSKEKTLVVFKSGLITAVSRILVGQFPEIEKRYASAETASTKWTIDRMELIELCRRIRRLSPSDPKLILKVEGSKTYGATLCGILSQQVGAVIEGEEFDFGVSAEYLEVACSLFRTEEIQILFTSNDSPITVVIEESDSIKIMLGQIQQ